MYEAIGIIVLNAVIFFATGYIIGRSVGMKRLRNNYYKSFPGVAHFWHKGGAVKQSRLRDGEVPAILKYEEHWYESNPGGDDRGFTVRGEERHINDFLAPEVTSDERPVFSDECGLGEPLPDFLAGLIDANGNVSWRDGVSLKCGVVLIWPSQRTAAIDNGWAVIGEEPDGKLRVTRDYKPDGYPWVEVPFPSWDGPTPDPRQNTATLVAEIELGRDPDAGEPVVMPPQPNLGGEGNPQYEGGNYTHETHLADEMKTIIHFRRDDDGEES